MALWDQVLQPASLAGLDRVELLTRAADAAGFAAQAQCALVLLTEALGPGCLAALDQAVRIVPAEPSAERARVLGHLAQWLMMADRDRDAVDPAKQALAVARTVGARAEEGHALDILGTCTADTAQLEEARRIAEEVGNAEGIGRLPEAHRVSELKHASWLRPDRDDAIVRCRW